jgi:hypothetical protein
MPRISYLDGFGTTSRPGYSRAYTIKHFARGARRGREGRGA